MLRNLLGTLRSYYAASAYLAPEFGRNRSTAFIEALWFRFRYGLSVNDLAIYSLDGKWPERPTEYVQGKHRVYDFMRKRMLKAGASPAVDNKIAFHQRCVRNAIPTPAIIVAVPGRTVDPKASIDPVPLASMAGDFQDHLDASSSREFFCKPFGGRQGKGGFAFRRTATGFSRSGNALSAQALFDQTSAIADRYGTMIVEERLRLHPAMMPISPSGALSTVRIVTALEDGNVRQVAALLKICAGDNETDNFHKGLTGNLIANINLETGRLSKAIGSVSREFPLMRSYARHPDSEQLIEGFQLPDWRKLLTLVETAHREFSEFWTLGWDVALTDRGPVIVEANCVWAVEFVQAALGKGLRHEFDRWKGQLDQERVSIS